MRVFDKVNDDRHQALEPLEGAAEIFGAWRERHDMRHFPRGAREALRGNLIDECMDTVQATANLLAAIGATQGEVDAAIKRMDERNGDRGRL